MIAGGPPSRRPGGRRSGVRHLELVEFQTRTGVPLSPAEREALRRLVPSIAITPTSGGRGYDLTPGAWVGAVRLGTLAIEIRPKLPVSQVLFLLSYAVDPRRWAETTFDFAPGTSLLEAIVPAFLAQVRRAVRRGLFHGYRTEEASLPVVRGQVRLDAQVGRRYGLIPPVESRFDEFTPDVAENRLLRAALHRLSQLPWRSARLGRDLRAMLARFAGVGEVTNQPAAFPAIRYSRLNEHYRPAVELARRILRGTAFDLQQGQVVASAFLVDMGQAFEDFVVVALREALGLTAYELPQGASGRAIYLDRAETVQLRPDLSWWDGDRCTFVGDVKYKRTPAAGVEHPDLYQLLAYTLATGLPSGLLVYAAGEGEPVSHFVDPGAALGPGTAGWPDATTGAGDPTTRWGKALQVTALDLADPPEAILAQVRTLAGRVRRLRRAARSAMGQALTAGDW